MTFTVPLCTTSLKGNEAAYVNAALEDGMISSTGSFVSRFEAAVAAKIGVRHVMATASGTSALELLLRAMDVGPGDEVIVPAFSFASPALAVALVGAVPIFADVSAETWTLDPAAVKQALSPRTKAVIAVDVLGHPCDFDALMAFGVPVIEDAAEAHGATYKGRPAGSCGTASIFSFHANKTVTCGEGGCVATDDTGLADRVRQLNWFGMDPDRRYWHTAIGGKYRMTNLVAAVGLAQVERWDDLVEGRNRTAAHYDRVLQGLPLQRRPVAAWAGEAVWLYTVATDKREGLLRACETNGIDARALWPDLPSSPAFAAFDPAYCPRARAIADIALWLPTWADMPVDVIDHVAHALKVWADVPVLEAAD